MRQKVDKLGKFCGKKPQKCLSAVALGVVGGNSAV
jgi:hypothetical protein